MANSICLIGLSIILLPAIRSSANLISVGNQTDSSSQFNISHFLPLIINQVANNKNDSVSSLPSIEPIILDSKSIHSVIDGNNFKQLINNISTSNNFTNGLTINNNINHLHQQDQNVSSSVIEHRLWTSKRVRPVREPVKESTSEQSSSDSGDERSNNSFDELKFDQNYFALLNAVNHRPISTPMVQSDPLTKKDANLSSDPTVNATRSLFYYSPETYGKVSHKNHQNTAFTFSWPPPLSQSTIGLPTPTPLTQIKNILPSSGPTSSALIVPENHPGKPSKHDSGSFSFSNSPTGIQSFSSSDNKQSNNTTIKNDYQPNKFFDPNKLIVDRGQQSTGGGVENKNYNRGSSDESGEINGNENNSETSESNSDGNSDSNQSSNLIKDSNSVQSGNGESGGGINSNFNKYYDTGAYMISKTRSKVSQGPINGGGGGEGQNNKPLRFQDHVISQPPLTPSIDYLEEDYESTDAFPDFKNIQPIVKSPPGTLPASAAKYNGPAPYRHPYYSSYYPTRFYGPPPSPYEDDNSPSKAGPNNVNSWSGLAGFLLGIIPLGILMASMVPAFVSVPVATAAAGVGRRRRRRRSLSIHTLQDDPVHDILGQYEMKMLRDVDCIKEILCKIAVQGKSQKMGKHFFEAAINMRFNKIYHQLGIGKIMETVKINQCDKVFQCKKLIKR